MHVLLLFLPFPSSLLALQIPAQEAECRIEQNALKQMALGSILPLEASPERTDGGRPLSSSGLPGIDPNPGEMLPGADGG